MVSSGIQLSVVTQLLQLPVQQTTTTTKTTTGTTTTTTIATTVTKIK